MNGVIKKIILEYKDVKDFRYVRLNLKKSDKTSCRIVKVPEMKVTRAHVDHSGYRHVDTAYVVNAYDVVYKRYIHIDDDTECEITGEEWNRKGGEDYDAD